MQKLIECVPNFSEGRDANIIRQITDAIESAEGVSLLDVDPGATTNRTVVTFVGTPEAAVEGAFRGIQKAAELIDMRKHKGAHPRMGATDVCPFIPVSNVTWEEATACAKQLGRRVGEELRKVPEPYRTTLILRDLEEMSYEEIAEVLEVSLGTVKSRLTRGRDALRQRLAPYVREVGNELGLTAPKEQGSRSRIAGGGRRVEVTR